MSEITRVPLPPVGKGSIGRLWLGVVLAVLAGIGIAYVVRPVHFTQLRVVTIKDGAGKSPGLGDVALINYVGRLALTDKEFDRGDGAALPLQGVIPGFSKGLQQMKVGGKYRLEIPAALAYGSQAMPAHDGHAGIPANSDLVFDVELIDFRSQAELEKQRAAIQAMQAQMQGAGMPAGAGAPAGN